MLNHKINNIKISEFDYNLPDELIAKYPLNKRDGSKLLIYDHKKISETLFYNINKYLDSNCLLVFNNTKVVQARLLFKRPTGSTIEVFILEPIAPSDYAISFSTNTNVTWKCIIGNLKKWKEDSLKMEIPETSSILIAQKGKILLEGVEVQFSWNNTDLSFARIIELCGKVPIPPYLERDSEEIDKLRYQTVYAKPKGSVAAPTAGLHFTKNVIKSLIYKEIQTDYLTLHVGAGTFKPVKNDLVVDHEMHTEHFIVKRSTLENLIKYSNKVVSVGTTSLRTLESIYWLGVKAFEKTLQAPYSINQWEPYQMNQSISNAESLKSLVKFMELNDIKHIEATTQILIVPGYQFRVVNKLITNFHQPKSTLLLLVAAFIGDDWKKVYNYAFNHNFRFLSYGDSSLLTRNEL